MTNDSTDVAATAQSFNENAKEMKKFFFLHEPICTLDALVALGRIVYKGRLDPITMLSCSLCCDYLYVKYGFTTMQSIFISAIMRVSKPMTIQAISAYLGVTTDRARRCEKDLNSLVDNGMLVVSQESGNGVKAYYLSDNLRKSIYSIEAE